MGVGARQQGQRSAHQATAAQPRPVVAGLLVWVLAACIAGTPGASPTASSEPTPTPSPIPTPQATPTVPESEWVRQFGTEDDEHAHAVAVDASGVYVVGSVEHASFVRKYDLDGSELWTRYLSSDDLVATAVAVDASGVYVAGSNHGALAGQTNAGTGADAFVRKYDPDGAELWTRQFGTPPEDWATAVTIDASGLYVVGLTAGSFTGQTSAGGGDAFIRKYDHGGTKLWTRQFGTSADDSAGAVAVDASALYVAGWTEGTLPGQRSGGVYDAFIVKYGL